MTSTEVQYRCFNPDMEVRSGGDGRTVTGIAVPYDVPMRINESLVEVFTRGAFDHQMKAANRVRFSREHMALGGSLIGAVQMMRDDARGLYVEMRASKTPVGDETIELIRDGALNQLSIGFRERQNRKMSGGIVQRVKADLVEVAAVLEGAYGDYAVATGVRSAQHAVAGADIELRQEAEQYLLGAGLPDLPDVETQLRALRLGIGLRGGVR